MNEMFGALIGSELILWKNKLLISRCPTQPALPGSRMLRRAPAVTSVSCCARLNLTLTSAVAAGAAAAVAAAVGAVVVVVVVVAAAAAAAAVVAAAAVAAAAVAVFITKATCQWLCSSSDYKDTLLSPLKFN
ncbi:hypothetical protein FHG87_006081 [Trinorchestia longiramus]|nr:hypothetical protein FHG87_006081 [Trinorchestia longiramus]